MSPAGRKAAAYGAHVIRTKLAPPRPPRRIVHREAVLDTLALGVERKLTVLRAPAGFGKTTVLVDWRERLLTEKRIVAWITLDADDNDPSQLVAYLRNALIEALGHRANELPELQAGDEIASPKVSLTSIINALDRLRAGVTLILDDVDRIHAGPVLDLLAFLILNAPPTLHFILATRTELSLPLAYLRAQDELVEINAEGLRFSIQDSRNFLNELGGLKLDAGQTRSLHDATEGWAAGLQMAAIALRGRADPGQLIHSFSGTHRAVNDYLASAVLPNLDDETVHFLLHTSILERLNGSLCAHLTGIANGAQMLERLSQQNLFIQVLDDEGRWFRYHALFADFLRDQLERREPGLRTALHERAAHWFADHKLWSEAVRHALAAERVDLASQWVELCAMREVEDSHVHNLLGWARKLPEAAIGTRLRIAMAWALLLTIQLDEAARIVDDLTRQLADGKLKEDGDAVQIETELLSLRFCITALRDETAEALEIAESGFAAGMRLRPQQEHDVWVVQALLNGMSHCYMRAGNIERARAVQQPEWYPMLPDRTRNLFTVSYRACLLGGCDVQEGRLIEGARHFRQALDLAETHAGRRSGAATLVACSLATLHYEWDELEELDQLLADRLDLIDEACFLDSVRSAYLALARLSAARNDFEAAHGFLNRAELVASRRRWPRLATSALAEHVRLWLVEGRPLDADRTLTRLETLTSPTPPTTHCAASETWRLRCIARARLHLHRHEAKAAIDLLRNVLDDENPTRHPYPAVRTRMLLAIGLEQSGQSKLALEQVEQALGIAEPAGMIHSISDEGPAAAALVKQLATAGRLSAATVQTPWFIKLRGALGLNAATAEATETRKPRVNPLLLQEPLSQRERDVLTLVAQGLSNEETARTLMLSTETVKWHLKNIYSKLGVSSRTLAVHRARQMDLMHDPASPL